MDLIEWAAKWGVSAAALADLASLGQGEPVSVGGTPGSEAYVQSAIRLAAPGQGVKLWRNNVGALRDEYGRPVRYGLANDSAALNARLKSADLVGWKRLTIEPHHVGQVLAQFYCREVKAADWTYHGTEREVAQLAWATLVNAEGGNAAFATGPHSL